MTQERQTRGWLAIARGCAGYLALVHFTGFAMFSTRAANQFDQRIFRHDRRRPDFLCHCPDEARAPL